MRRFTLTFLHCLTAEILNKPDPGYRLQVPTNLLVSAFFHFKGYLRYKTIFCHQVALDAQLMNFFIWNKNNVSFSRYLDFRVFVKSTNFKICDVIISTAAWWSYTYNYFFWILSPIRMKLGQILVCCMTKISKIFLV